MDGAIILVKPSIVAANSIPIIPIKIPMMTVLNVSKTR